MCVLCKFYFNFLLFLVFALFFTVNSQAGFAESKIENCYTIGYATSEADMIEPYKAPMQAIYNNIGHCISYLELPYARLMKMIDNSEIDAIMGRSQAALKSHSDLPYVPTPLIHLKAYLITRPDVSKSIKLNVNEFSEYIIGGLFGSDWTMETLDRLSKDTRYAENIDQLVLMYKMNRVDGFLVSELFLPYVMKALSESENASFQAVWIDTLPVYHVLAPRHKNLVKSLDRSVRAVQASLISDAATQLAILSE